MAATPVSGRPATVPARLDCQTTIQQVQWSQNCPDSDLEDRREQHRSDGSMKMVTRCRVLKISKSGPNPRKRGSVGQPMDPPLHCTPLKSTFCPPNCYVAPLYSAPPCYEPPLQKNPGCVPDLLCSLCLELTKFHE